MSFVESCRGDAAHPISRPQENAQMTRSTTRLASVLGMTLALSLLAVDAADARRGGLGMTLLRLGLVGGGIGLLMTLFRRRRAQPAGYPREAAFGGGPQPFGTDRGFDGGGAGQRTTYTPQTPPPAQDIGLTQAD